MTDGCATFWSRRRFLGRLGRASAAAACAAPVFFAACATARWASHERVPGGIDLAPEEVLPGEGALVDVSGLPAPLYVHRHRDGRVTAVLTRCTHRGCTAAPRSERIVCPCHGSEYELDGVVVQGPAERNLSRFPARVEPDRIHVELGDAS